MSKKRRRKESKSVPSRVTVNRSRRNLYLVGVAISAIVLVATLFSPRKNDSGSSSPTAAYSYEIVAEYPHDPNAFCQGLVFHDGLLYESTGEYGESTVRCVDLETGIVKQQFEMPDEYFGEGLAVAEDQLVQLTWKAGLGFTYDIKTLQPTGGFVYEREGWGLTFDGEHFVMSDGSDRLRFLDPESFQVVRTIQVKDQGKRIDDLNELEYIKGEIFANLWYSDFIARISPETGSVLGWIDLRGLLKAPRHEDSVLNGIAYDSENDRLFVTGKNWPALFEIKLKTR